MKQTAVEWLIHQFWLDYPEMMLVYKKECDKARQIEKQQIKEAYSQGREDSNDFVLVNEWKYTSEDYYNETFK
jgi:hypothetical protein